MSSEMVVRIVRLKQLEALNAATLEARRHGHANPSRPMDFPFLGYYEADIFECEPFLMFTNNDCPRALSIFFGRNFELTSMKLWCRLAKTASGILDIGANVGVYSLAAASLRNDIAVHAFEPNPHAYARLRMHKLLNHFNNIIEHTFAVGDKNEYVNFSWTVKAFPQISSGGSVTTVSRKGIESVLVPMRTLDGTGLAATLGAKALIKIDVEGGEASTFRGMSEVLALRPDVIIETFSRESCEVINALIAPLGYNVFLIVESEGRLEQRSSLIPCDPSGSDNYNQFISTQSAAQLAVLMS